MAQIYDKTLYDQMYSVPAWEHGVRDVSRVPRHHYNWFVQSQQNYARLRNNVKALQAVPGWSRFSDVAVIGGGFGWTIELLRETNPSLNAVNVEISPHVINSLESSEEEDLREYLIEDGFDPDHIEFLVHPVTHEVLSNEEAWSHWLRPDGKRTSVTTIDVDLFTEGQRRHVQNVMNGKIDAVITEISLDSLSTGAELDNFLDAVEMTRPNKNCEVIHLTEYTPDMSLGYISKPLDSWGNYLTTRGFGDHILVDPHGTVQRADGVD